MKRWMILFVLLFTAQANAKWVLASGSRQYCPSTINPQFETNDRGERVLQFDNVHGFLWSSSPDKELPGPCLEVDSRQLDPNSNTLISDAHVQCPSNIPLDSSRDIVRYSNVQTSWTQEILTKTDQGEWIAAGPKFKCVWNLKN